MWGYLSKHPDIYLYFSQFGLKWIAFVFFFLFSSFLYFHEFKSWPSLGRHFRKFSLICELGNNLTLAVLSSFASEMSLFYRANKKKAPAKVNQFIPFVWCWIVSYLTAVCMMRQWRWHTGIFHCAHLFWRYSFPPIPLLFGICKMKNACIQIMIILEKFVCLAHQKQQWQRQHQRHRQ